MTKALFPDLVVNGETVPHTAIAAEVQNHDAPRGKPGIAWRKAARALAMRTLLLQEARRRNICATPREIAPGRFETEEEALVRALLDVAVTTVPTPGEAVQAEYLRDPDRFRSPPLWEVSHILIACDPRDRTATGATETRARDLTRRALDAPESFARLAKDESDCGSASAGGTLGQLGPGDTVPEFETALRGLGPGEITADPVLTRHGWHVIRLDAQAKGKPLPFETVRGHIADAMDKAQWARAARAFVSDLIDTAHLTGVDFPGT